MQIQFDINRSLKACPPNKQHGTGVIHIERKSGKLKDLVTNNHKGVSLQPREKEVENKRADGEVLTFHLDGVLYKKEVMVAELREDGKEELISGYNRRDYLMSNYGDDVTYFYDVVKFETPYYKTMWKRRYNSSDDHRAQGIPNNVGAFLKGLVEAKNGKEFDSTNDDEVRSAIDFMAKGTKSIPQIESILTKFRETNSKEVGIRALNSNMANDDAKKLKLPTKGYVKNLSDPRFGQVGFTRGGGDFTRKIVEYVNHYVNYNEKIKITGFILFAEHDKIKKQRKKWLEDFNKSLEWMRKHLAKEFHDIIEFQGFLAQITTADETQGGKPKERGLVDVNGKIIREQ